MKAKILLAEAATSHEDGTTSILRAGITHVWGEQFPVPLRGALYVRMEAGIEDKGNHTFDLRCMDEDGADVSPEVAGRFHVDEGGGVTCLVLGVAIGFKKHGRFLFVLRVDSVERDTWVIHCVKERKAES